MPKLLGVKRKREEKEDPIKDSEINKVEDLSNIWKPIPGFDNYEVNNESIRNKTTKHILKISSKGTVSLRNRNKIIVKSSGWFILIAHFPKIEVKECVFHKDLDWKNNHIDNLEFLTRSEVSKRIKTGKKISKKTIKKISKLIGQYDDEQKLIQTFSSAVEASRVLNITRRNIRNSIDIGTKAGGYRFKRIKQSDQQFLPGEIWIEAKNNQRVLNLLQKHRDNIENIGKVRISNLGRIFTSNDIITSGSSVRKRYRAYNNIEIHRLVYAAFGQSDLKENQEVCHIDELTLDEDGCINNAITNLYTGTHSENMMHAVQHGNLRKMCRPVVQISLETDNVITNHKSSRDAARALGNKMYAANINAVCRGKHKHSYGFKWKYADELDENTDK